MRGGKLEVIKYEDKIIGVVLCADHCAEHEWGIEPLKRALEMNEAMLGVDARTVQDRGCLQSGTKWFTINYEIEDTKKALSQIKGFHDFYKSYTSSGLWDDTSAVAALNPSATEDEKAAFKLIHKCIAKDGKLFIMRAGQGPFGGGGLTIIPAELVPPEEAKKLYLRDVAAKELAAAWKPVSDMLNAKAKQAKSCEFLEWAKTQEYAYMTYCDTSKRTWCYLGPKELSEVAGSKYPFRLWLNPNEQQIFAAGWYTVEQILEWFDGHGPVITRSRLYGLREAQKAILKGEEAYPSDYYAICHKCGHIHHDGNAEGRQEFLGKTNTWCSSRIKVLTVCLKCGVPADTLVFSTDNPEHYRNKLNV